jgi:hypothetical protein
MLAHAHLVDLIEAHLTGAPAVAGGQVGRFRTRAVSADTPQAVNVRLGRSVPQPLAGYGAPVDYDTQLVLECLGRARGNGGAGTDTDTDTVAGQVLQEAHSRIAANAAALDAAGFSITLAPSLQWAQDDADERIGVVIAIYNVQHRAASLTLETLS